MDLVLAGHVHHYERTHATKHNGAKVALPVLTTDGVERYASPGAPVYVNIGMGGAGERLYDLRRKIDP